MYLSVIVVKWTNVVCLFVGMLISSMMDVVIISAKLVCHLYFVCKLNYLFGAHMCYGGVGMKFCPMPRAHEQARRVRSMELEIRLASAQGWSILRTPPEMCQSI